LWLKILTSCKSFKNKFKVISQWRTKGALRFVTKKIDELEVVQEQVQGHHPVAYPGIFFGGVKFETFFPGGVFQQIQLRTEDRENGDLGALAPSHGFRSICK
jgi:hypothetical protein